MIKDKYRFWYTNGKSFIHKEFTMSQIINGYPFEVLSDNPLLKNWRMMPDYDKPTGFKDKNGQEIYEGDILGDWNEIDGEMEQSRQQVFFDEAAGQWGLDYSKNQDKTHWFALFDELKNFEYEIIGNIHENPELLK